MNAALQYENDFNRHFQVKRIAPGVWELAGYTVTYDGELYVVRPLYTDTGYDKCKIKANAFRIIRSYYVVLRIMVDHILLTKE